MMRENVLRGWDRSQFRGFERACYASSVEDASHTGAQSVRIILDVALSLCRGVFFDPVVNAEVFFWIGIEPRIRAKTLPFSKKDYSHSKDAYRSWSCQHDIAARFPRWSGCGHSFGFAVQICVEERFQVPLGAQHPGSQFRALDSGSDFRECNLARGRSVIGEGSEAAVVRRSQLLDRQK
jgi:hypothetical protein